MQKQKIVFEMQRKEFSLKKKHIRHGDKKPAILL